tara:strand:+ start:22671 stop:23342 length:672 start_codon:yes stop_codon:yes gene_type:complete
VLATTEETKAMVNVLKPASVVSNIKRVDETLTLPDLLYSGLQALDADRLLTPDGDNAFDFFARALAMDSDNDLAKEGIAAIVARYLALAREAIGNGSFDSAVLMIERAKLVDATVADIALVQVELANERESGDLFFTFDGAAVSAQSNQARDQLADIARRARECSAFFLITAPNDSTARWMFSVMRESVEGYRLRGNIELSAQTGVRLRLPDTITDEDTVCAD